MDSEKRKSYVLICRNSIYLKKLRFDGSAYQMGDTIFVPDVGLSMVTGFNKVMEPCGNTGWINYRSGVWIPTLEQLFDMIPIEAVIKITRGSATHCSYVCELTIYLDNGRFYKTEIYASSLEEALLSTIDSEYECDPLGRHISEPG